MSLWGVVLGMSGTCGGAIAEALARDPGLHIYGFHRGRHSESAAAVAAKIEACDRRAVCEVMDAGTHAGAEAGADRLLDHAGPRSIGIFVHALANASVGPLVRGGREPPHPSQIASTFEGMAHSFVYWTRALYERELLAPGARVLALTNPLIAQVVRDTPVISASKAALHAYVRHLARELGPLGYRVNALEFASMVSPAVQETFSDAAAKLQRIAARINPAGRMCSTDDLGRFVSLLCDERADWINGAVIDFTGAEFQGLYDALVYSERDT